MDELVRFLNACLDEDAKAARKAAALCGCHPPAPSWTFRDGDEPTDGRILVVDEPHPGIKRKISRRWNRSYEGMFMAEHIVRHDPARALAEVDAKRQIIRLHSFGTGHECSTLDDNGDIDHCTWVMDSEACTTLRLLALPYADHPGYREEWRP